MTRDCLNPDCDNDVPVIGVCVACANSRYDPEEDGVDIEEYDPNWREKVGNL